MTNDAAGGMRDDPPYRELTRRLERVRSIYIHTRVIARSLETRRCHLLAENERRAVAGEINRLADILGDASSPPLPSHTS